MKSKHVSLILAFLVIGNFVWAQEYAVDKKAIMISGVASFNSQSGELFEDSENNKATTFNLSPSVNYFLVKNFFAGGGMTFNSETQGDYKSSTLAFGPQVGYAFGKAESNVFPYIDFGLRCYFFGYDYNGNTYNLMGSSSFVGAGIIFALKSHIGITLEGNYNMVDLEEKDGDVTYSGNTFTIGIGITGLFF